MPLLINTTYRHDYVDFKKAQHSYACSLGPVPPQLDLLNSRAGATAAGRGHSEWTGIAPACGTFRTRIIPNATDAVLVAQTRSKTAECERQKTNRFLLNVYDTNPELWAVLVRQSQAHNTNRMFSTYQVNYGGMVEWPTGVYEADRVPPDCAGRTVAETRGHWQAQDKVRY